MKTKQKTTKVSITFEVPEKVYNDYEYIVQDFDDALQSIGIYDTDIFEVTD